MKNLLTAHEMLCEAQMHLECVSEALNEIECLKGKRSRKAIERLYVVEDEITSRLWGAIYLIQVVRLGPDGAHPPINFKEVLESARAFDLGIDESPEETKKRLLSLQ